MQERRRIPRRSEHGALRLHVHLRIRRLLCRACWTATIERAVQMIRECADQLVTVWQLLGQLLGPALGRPRREQARYRLVRVLWGLGSGVEPVSVRGAARVDTQ